MALNAKAKEGGNFDRPEPLDAGTYPARLVRILDLGVQKQRPYKGEPKDPAQEIDLTWEMTDEFMLDENGNEIEDKPRWVSETMPFHTLDKDKAKSTNRYLALDPNIDEDGDWEALLGRPCMISIVQGLGKGKNEGRIYENVDGATAMSPKQVKKTEPLVNKATSFSMDDPDLEVFNNLPEWMRDKIKGSLSYGGSALEKALEGGGDAPADDDNDDDEENW